MKKRIYLSPPHIGNDELKYVHEAFESNWVAPVGPNIDNFEKELAVYNNVHHVAAVSSGTAAIHLALSILGVSDGDEVICSSFTFAGTCNPIVYLGAKPVFVDSEAQTWNLDPQLLEEAITDRIKKTGKKPKAIIPVHLYGMPAQIDTIMEISLRYGIPVIEDAAEALGGSFRGKRLGTFGDIGVFSFNGNKIITTSGGGALLSSNKSYVDKAKFLATQARDQAPHYQHSQIGYNYRLSNILAGIGRGQLQQLDERVARRRRIFDYYVDALRNTDVSFQPEAPHSYSNRWLTCIVLGNSLNQHPEEIRMAFEAENIETRPLWKPMHLQPVFRDLPYYGKGVCDELFNKGICLPSGSQMQQEDLERVTSLLIRQLSKSPVSH